MAGHRAVFSHATAFPGGCATSTARLVDMQSWTIVGRSCARSVAAPFGRDATSRLDHSTVRKMPERENPKIRYPRSGRANGLERREPSATRS
jgi:hypothetical protein